MSACGACQKVAHGVVGLAKAVICIDQADATTVAERREACRFCEHSDKRGPTGLTTLSLCGKCGCVIAAKTLLASETCPDGRWPSISPGPAKA